MNETIARDMLERGYSRRQFARAAALLSAAAGLPFFNETALAQGLSAGPPIPPDAVRLNANESPLGPCPEAVAAVLKALPRGGRYAYDLTFEFVETLAAAEGLSKEEVLPFAGSSDPLHRAVLAFTSPTRSFVLADPGYEAGEKAAQFLGARVHKVPLRADASHDVRAMAAADPVAGLIYVCNPNNPTGSVTRPEDVAWLVAHKPKGSVLLLDEAYIHFSTTAEPGTAFVTAGKDVVILRTFSKVYGLAGLRAGAAFGRPDLLERIKGYGAGALPITGMAAATASLRAAGLVESRRKLFDGLRAETAGWLASKGFPVLPSEANMLMIGVKRPGKAVFDAMLKEKVAIGRVWPSMPEHVRVTIGSRDEMAQFRAAFARVMQA